MAARFSCKAGTFVPERQIEKSTEVPLLVFRLGFGRRDNLIIIRCLCGRNNGIERAMGKHKNGYFTHVPFPEAISKDQKFELLVPSRDDLAVDYALNQILWSRYERYLAENDQKRGKK